MRGWPVRPTGLALAVASLVVAVPPGSAEPAGEVFRAAGVTRLEPPKTAPNLSVVVAGESRRPLSELRGQPVMVWFFASW